MFCFCFLAIFSRFLSDQLSEIYMTCILGCLLFLICIEFVNLYFPVLICLSVSVKSLAVKTASEITYIVSSGALNSTPTNQLLDRSSPKFQGW